jgi:glycosyltransferase involved in cell wall biosynthesis
MSLTDENNLVQKRAGGAGPQNVSILMPVYNGSEFLPESVSSVIQQTFTEWELLIAINGYDEAENTIFIMVRDYIKAIGETRIKVLDYYDCKGKAATLNKMLNECQYPYVAILDVDDIWLPGKLAAQQPFLQKGYDVIGAKCVYFGDMNNFSPPIPTGDISKFNFLEGNPVINSSAIIKKELAQWSTTCIVEDYDLWLRLWKEQRRFYNCEEVLVKHRIHKESAFNSKGNNKGLEALRLKYI